jgi:hypothetical protein
VSGNTRCPKCGTIFPVAPPAFEVVPPAPRSAPAKPAPKPAPKPLPPPPAAKPEPQFEVVGEPKKRVTKAADDDEDDRPRTKRRVDDDDEDEEDEDDRPRAKKRRRDEDDDDEDDRPRKKKGTGKKKRFQDDDEYDDWRPQRRGDSPFAKAKTGATLIGVSYWLNLAAYGLLCLFVLIAWLAVVGESSGSGSSRGGGGRSSSGSGDGGSSFVEFLVILPGLIGLSAWIVGLIGCSFAIAGPGKSRGMAITATVFSAVHLLLVGVAFSKLQDGLSMGNMVPGAGKAAWVAVASLLPAVDLFLPMLFYQSKAIDGDYVIVLLAGVCEAGRLIFGLLALKALATAAKDYNASERSGYGMMIVIGVLGGVVLLALLVAVVLNEGKFKSINTVINLTLGTLFLMYLAYTLMMLAPAIAAFGTRDACARKA